MPFKNNELRPNLKKWLFRVSVSALFIAILLLIIVLNPILSYAGKLQHHNYTIFYNKVIDANFFLRLDEATQLVKTNEFYDPSLHLDICLHDGSEYPDLIQKIRRPAFAWGFYDKVVLMGNASYQENYVELNGYKWNLSQLLAHEMIHCYQFHKLGLLKSNPLANIPAWKWEGYPEYVARTSPWQTNLHHNISYLISTEKTDHHGWIQFPDQTGTVITYYKSWLLTQYCIDVKKMTYKQILDDVANEESISVEMMNWYNGAK